MCSETLRNDMSLIGNEDWEVTKEIYAHSVVEEGVIEFEISLHDMVGFRRILQSNEVEYDDCSKVAPSFEYCILSTEILQPPTVRLSFNYDEDRLDSIDVSMKYFPHEFLCMQVSPMSLSPPTKHNDNENNNDGNENTNPCEEWIQWLQSKTNNILEETEMSFSICDFIEHQALDFFNIVHRDDALGYSAIFFKDEIRYTNVEQQQSSWKHSKFFDVMFTTRKMNDETLSQITGGDTKGSGGLDQYAKRTIQLHWKKLFSFECPICFDTEKCDDGTEFPCQHFVCKTCAEMYIKTKMSELSMYRHSPFICPIVSCKEGIKIQSGDYPISGEDRKEIMKWKYNITYPKTTMLSQCPRKVCKSTDMRRASSSLHETLVFCNTCKKAFCELCIKRFDDRECKWDHETHECDERHILKLCRRYKNAKDEIKLKAEEKWHWLKEYAERREEDLSACLWVRENASRCPNCRTAIERIAGCFHIHCTSCGTHFCYECGDELHYPFYGTHHCWEEEGQGLDDFDY